MLSGRIRYQVCVELRVPEFDLKFLYTCDLTTYKSVMLNLPLNLTR